MADHRNTLLRPFEAGLLAWPQAGEKWAVLNADVLPINGEQPVAEPAGTSRENLRTIVTCEQGFRPQFLALEAAGFRVSPGLADLQQLDGCMVLASRSRMVNERNLCRAWNGLKQGGHLVFAGDNKSGAQALRKWASGRAPLCGSLSKHHAVAFWMERQGAAWQDAKSPTAAQRYHVGAGMFSADGPDPGSRLLAQHFDRQLRGHVADFGAGWGYLSCQLLEKCPDISRLELYEADWASLEAAKLNLGDRAAFHWVDLTTEAPTGPFDWIVMNPPFHRDRAATPELGIAFIRAAARALPAGGRLLMVANTRLPYEKPLQSLFKRVDELEISSGFKVLLAKK